MARTDLSNINNSTKESIIQRNDEIKTEFHSREGTYKISSLIDNLGKIGTNQCLNEPVKITLLSRNCNHHDDDKHLNGNDNIIPTDILAFNVGRELIIYEFTQPTQPNFGEPIDHRIYKLNHQPTCHDIIQHENILHVLVGFSKGQIQYINMETKEQKVFNEGSYLDKTKVTCIKWLSNPQTYFLASYSSGYLYIFDEQLNHQPDNTNAQPTYSTVKDDEKNYSVSHLKTKVKQARNPVARWSIGSGSINEFALSPDHTLLAVVSQDGFLRIFNYEKMELIAYMKSYFGGLLCVCWSPDGKYIATGGEDDFLTLFSIDSENHTSRVICRGHGHTSWISAISFDPYMNAKTYYSSLLNNDNSDIKKSLIWSRSDSSYFDTTIPSLFYRICTVGQDNRLCLWDITEDLLKITYSNKQITPSSLSYPLIPNNCRTLSTDSQQSITKSSLSSLTSRLSFKRNLNKVNKSHDDTPDITLINLSNGSKRKSRKFSTKSSTTSDESNREFSSSSSRRINIDLTKTTFGTTLCPKLNDIQIIEPILAEFISHERLNSISFSKNYFLTSSQDGIISLWEKPQKFH